MFLELIYYDWNEKIKTTLHIKILQCGFCCALFSSLNVLKKIGTHIALKLCKSLFVVEISGIEQLTS